MRQFILIHEFSKLYSNFTDLLTENGINNFRAKLESEEGKDLAKELGLDHFQMEEFIASLSNSQNVLFHDWVNQNASLKSILFNQKLVKFEDTANHLKHQFFEKFQEFISPALSEKLLKYAGEKDLTTLEKVFSYVCLLDKKHRSTAEDQLFQSIKKKVEKTVANSKIVENETALVEAIQPLCDDKIIACINSLSRASYSLKLAYVDDVLAVLKFKSCTPRFANWILKRLEVVQLNKEHEFKIIDLRKDLKEGELQVRNHGIGRAPIKWGSIATFGLIALVAGLTFWVVKFKPFSDVEEPLFDNETSFMQFSKEERKKIDSLLIHMNGNLEEDDLMIDQGIPLIGESDQLTLRKNFENEELEQLYTDFIADADLREGLLQDSCTNGVPFSPLKGTEDLGDVKGDVNAMIKNESEYDAIIIVAEPSKKGAVYSLLIKKGATKSFLLKKYQYVMVIAGNDFQTYESPKGISKDQLPSEDFSHYFCDIDFNYKQSINTVYQLLNIQNGKVKLLLMGDKGSMFHVVDINAVLEEV